jgi:hypothetical protein
MPDTISHLNVMARKIHGWSLSNFGEQDPINPLMGMVEEAGVELQEAITEDQMLDAVADTLIFMCDHIGRKGWDLEECVEMSRSWLKPRVLGTQGLCLEIFKNLGVACKAELKSRQQIRGSDHEAKHMAALGNIWNQCDVVLRERHGTNAYQLTNTVFTDEVSKRDWVKYPKNGTTE